MFLKYTILPNLVGANPQRFSPNQELLLDFPGIQGNIVLLLVFTMFAPKMDFSFSKRKKFDTGY